MFDLLPILFEDESGTVFVVVAHRAILRSETGGEFRNLLARMKANVILASTMAVAASNSG